MAKSIMLAMAVAGAMTLATGPALAGKAKAPANKGQVEQKCDKAGKHCTKGTNCKKDNCKKESPAGEPPPADGDAGEDDPADDE